MKFKKKILLSVAVMSVAILSSHAQTGIGVVNPDNSAQLDISSDKRGLLMPRLALVKTTEKTPVVGTPAKSLMVYNTATSEDVTPGFYYWDGTKWIRVVSAGDIDSPWYDKATNTPATLNTQSLYTLGTSITIGKLPGSYANYVSPGLDVQGAIKFGASNSYPMQEASLAGGNDVMVGGYGSVAIGTSIIATGTVSATFGSDNINKTSNSFVSGFQNLLGAAGTTDFEVIDGLMGSAIFGSANSILLTEQGVVPKMYNNTIFGQKNKIDSQGNIPLNFNNNTIFGESNTILGAAGYTSANNTIFGRNNTISVYVGGNAAIFGENNIVNNNNQFVIGSGNENTANALFEIGIGTSSVRANAVTVLNNGNIGIGTSAPGTYRLSVNGTINAAGGISQVSDRRYKKDITPITDALDKIMKIQGVGYNWRTDEFKDKNFDNKHQLGVIAQDIEKILPDAVTKDNNGYYSVSYTALVPVLVEAVKEQQGTIVNQQKQIDELKILVKQLMDKK